MRGGSACRPCMIDLRDTHGRLVRLAIAAVAAAGLAVLVVAVMRQLVRAPGKEGVGWFAMATFGMVFVPSAIAVNALLARLARRRPAHLPVARVVRRRHAAGRDPW